MVNLLTFLTGAEISHNNSPIDDAGWDEDRNTSAGTSNDFYSAHIFTVAWHIKAITLYSYVYGNSNEHDGTYNLFNYTQYTLNGIDWIKFDVPSGTIWEYKHRDGRGDLRSTLDQVKYPVDVENCLGVRFMGRTTDFPDAKSVYLYELQVWADAGGGYSTII